MWPAAARAEAAFPRGVPTLPSYSRVKHCRLAAPTAFVQRCSQFVLHLGDVHGFFGMALAHSCRYSHTAHGDYLSAAAGDDGQRLFDATLWSSHTARALFSAGVITRRTDWTYIRHTAFASVHRRHATHTHGHFMTPSSRMLGWTHTLKLTVTVHPQQAGCTHLAPWIKCVTVTWSVCFSLDMMMHAMHELYSDQCVQP